VRLVQPPAWRPAKRPAGKPAPGLARRSPMRRAAKPEHELLRARHDDWWRRDKAAGRWVW
jgi:hypothetical protein